MGNISSSQSRSESKDTINRRSRLPGLKASGRYIHYKLENNVNIHLVGVVPCSTYSEEEVFDIINELKPSKVYLDLPIELIDVLKQQVNENKIGSSYAIPASTPNYQLYPNCGIISSVYVRNQLADNEFTALLGGELYGSFKSALAVIKKQEEQGSNIEVIPFPYSLKYNNGTVSMQRPSVVNAAIVGNAAFNSSTIDVLIGTAYKEAPVHQEISIPVATYFTKLDLQKIRDNFQKKVNSVTASAKYENFDADLEMIEIAEKAQSQNAVNDLLSIQSMLPLSRAHAQAIAYKIQEAAVADDVKENTNIVAVINLGQLGSVYRNWNESRPPTEVIPPFTMFEQSLGYVGPTAIVGGFGYVYYRFARRFKKTAIGVGTIFSGFAAYGFYAAIYSDWMRYGYTIRELLARPRIASPLARIGSR
jgi:hypothetical protein